MCMCISRIYKSVWCTSMCMPFCMGVESSVLVDWAEAKAIYLSQSLFILFIREGSFT